MKIIDMTATNVGPVKTVTVAFPKWACDYYCDDNYLWRSAASDEPCGQKLANALNAFVGVIDPENKVYTTPSFPVTTGGDLALPQWPEFLSEGRASEHVS